MLASFLLLWNSCEHIWHIFEVTCLTSLFYFTFIYVHTNFLIIIFLHQTNNTNICISDSHYNVCFSTPTSKQKQSWQSLPWEKKEEKYGVNYRSYFRNNLPLKKKRILISKLFSQIINLQWILQVKINPAKYERHCNWKRKGFGLNLDVPF